MEKRVIVILFVVGLLAGLGMPAAADPMSSANYRITTTVVSGGGGPMDSTSFQINATLGQSSPLIDPADPPLSAGYELLAGFWYTVGIEPLVSACPADFEPDGDVDKDDLDTLAAGIWTAMTCTIWLSILATSTVWTD